MNSKPPATNTSSYYDTLSDEWVTVITIRHAVENSEKPYPPQPDCWVKSKLEEAVSLVNQNSLSNATLSKVSPNSFWNK
jgi:hypothetical protein